MLPLTGEAIALVTALTTAFMSLLAVLLGNRQNARSTQLALRLQSEGTAALEAKRALLEHASWLRDRREAAYLAFVETSREVAQKAESVKLEHVGLNLEEQYRRYAPMRLQYERLVAAAYHVQIVGPADVARAVQSHKKRVLDELVMEVTRGNYTAGAPSPEEVLLAMSEALQRVDDQEPDAR